MNVPGKVNREVMTQKDIDDVIGAFAQAAADAKETGFDAVELHGAHGYLIDQFFWEGTNQRNDHYAGSIESRGRFAVELMKLSERRWVLIFRLFCGGLSGSCRITLLVWQKTLGSLKDFSYLFLMLE
jgi:2,4-dienoyl-CoA reductase-like NADH-dependent reductase (Old Yellow Enzyme family)